MELEWRPLHSFNDYVSLFGILFFIMSLYSGSYCSLFCTSFCTCLYSAFFLILYSLYSVNTCPYYLKEIFEFAPHCRIDTRNKFAKLKIPFRKTNMGQKAISFVGPSLWNSLPELIKKTDNVNTFKHNVKNYCLNWINNELMKWVSHCYYFMDLAILTYIHIYFLYFEYIFLFFSISL